jgi:hypothetical protein
LHRPRRDRLLRPARIGRTIVCGFNEVLVLRQALPVYVTLPFPRVIPVRAGQHCVRDLRNKTVRHATIGV